MLFDLERFVQSTAPALLDDHSGVWLSYKGLIESVCRGRDYLRTLGGKPLVMIFSANDIDTAVTLLSVLEADGTAALITGRLPPSRRQHLIERYRPRLVAGAAPDGPYRPHPPMPLGLPLWHRTDGDAADVHPELALLLSTSGSTGSAKLVRLSRRAVTANAHAIRQALGIRSEERSALCLPISYSYGLSVLSSHLAAGSSVLLTERSPVWADYWTRLGEHGVTSMPGVPSLYELMRRLHFPDGAPATLTTLTQAGGKLADHLIELFHRIMERRNGRLFVMYGQTEATARIAVLDSHLLPTKLGSVGRAIPGGRIEIEHLDPAAPGEGVIVYYGPNVMMGYAETAEDLAKGDVLGGRLETGDLGYMDDDGCLYVTGRIKRIAKINGNRINLDEVEALPEWGGSAAAIETNGGIVVFCEESDPIRLARMQCTVARSMGLLPRHLQLRPVSGLPLLNSGKTDYSALARLLGA